MQLSQEREVKLLNPNPSSISPSPAPSPSSATLRIWKPAAQRNLRNQWSKLLSHKDCWFSASSNGRSHATSLVNTYLSHRLDFSIFLYSSSSLSTIPPRRTRGWAVANSYHLSGQPCRGWDEILAVQAVPLERTFECWDRSLTDESSTVRIRGLTTQEELEYGYCLIWFVI